MPNNPANYTVDKFINNLMTARFNTVEDAIAPLAFPKIVVPEPNGKYPRLDNGYMRKDDDRLGAKGVANTVTWDFDTPGSFSISDYGYNTEIPGRQVREADPIIRRRYRNIAAKVVTDKLILEREIRAAAALFNTSAFPGEALTGTDRLNNPDSDLYAIFADAFEKVRKQSGKRANTIIPGPAVQAAIARHPQLLAAWGGDKLKTLMGPEEIMQIFGNKRMRASKYLVGDMQYNTAAEGQTAVWDDIWGKFLWIGYINYDAITELDSSATKTFVERGREGVQVKYYKASLNEFEESEDCRAETSYDQQVTDGTNGYLYTTAVD